MTPAQVQGFSSSHLNLLCLSLSPFPRSTDLKNKNWQQRNEQKRGWRVNSSGMAFNSFGGLFSLCQIKEKKIVSIPPKSPTKSALHLPPTLNSDAQRDISWHLEKQHISTVHCCNITYCVFMATQLWFRFLQRKSFSLYQKQYHALQNSHSWHCTATKSCVIVGDCYMLIRSINQ